jgi:hypothetical protein
MKKQQKEEDHVAREAAGQLQNDFKIVQKSKKKTSKASIVKNTEVVEQPAPGVVGEPSTTVNSRGRQIRLPQFRNN